jgi:membrane-bound lytic murein transglycosylase F
MIAPRVASKKRLLFSLLLFFTLWLIASKYYLNPGKYYLNPRLHLEIIVERGWLVVATRNSPTTYYQGRNGPAGLEYDLAHAFANELGVELQIVVANSVAELNRLLLQGEVDLVASGMPTSVSNLATLRYSSVYQKVVEQVIDRQHSKPKPRSIADLSSTLSTLPTIGHLETLSALQQSHPQLQWKIEQHLDFEEMMEMVANNEIPYALANSNEVQVIRNYYPNLRVAFSLPDEKGIAWTLGNTLDMSLFGATQGYIRKIKNNGYLNQLLERYYGHVAKFDYSGTQLFMSRIKSRLPKYQALFKEAGWRYSVDWRLIAAMSHQESQWNSKAVSPTGVRGLMMLTLTTASQLGVEDRIDPRQSVMGGTKYFSQLHKRLSESITEPDRTWMALAAYNIGYGHLRDARKITSMLDQDPDLWVNVKKNLPLLRKRKWYKKVKYGYARGDEAVHYVQNIRRYYDILTKFYGGNTSHHL